MDSSFPENEILTIVTIGIIIMLLLAVAFAMFFYFSQRKFQAERLAAQAKELKYQEQLLFSSIQGQEKERQRLARELHDEVGSKLNVINLGLHRLRKSTTDKPVVAEMAEELFNVLGDTIESTRRISHDLLPPILVNFGLEAALEELCDHYDKASESQVTFELCQNDSALKDRDIALNIFRVVQELLSNSIKHAKATLIGVRLWLCAKTIRLTYQENGKGFDPLEKVHQKGLGLQNIESRIRLIGAKYQLKSEAGEGVFFELLKQRS